MSGLPEHPARREAHWASQCCRYCIHWHAPAATLLAAYDAFREGIAKRPVKQPAGHCDRVLVAEDRPVSFSTTAAGFSCLNFQAIEPLQTVSEDGIVIIYEGDQILWQGREEDLPDKYR